MSDKRKVFVVSAPSGTGKTTLNRKLVTENPDVVMSVSYTTRPKRETEIEGVDYHFVSTEKFQQLIANGTMLEHAEVFGTLYGTSRNEVEGILASGRKALLEIDVQGWAQARTKLKNATSIFILPPSVEALWQRLSGRGTETEVARLKRLMTAKSEIECGHLYDYFIINEDISSAYGELYDIVINGKSGTINNEEGVAICKRLLREFEASPLLQKLSQDFADQMGGG